MFRLALCLLLTCGPGALILRDRRPFPSQCHRSPDLIAKFGFDVPISRARTAKQTTPTTHTYVYHYIIRTTPAPHDVGRNELNEWDGAAPRRGRRRLGLTGGNGRD